MSNDAVFGAQGGAPLPKDPTEGMTPEQKAAYDAETDMLDKKHGAAQKGYGRVIEEQMKFRAPSIGTTVDPGPKE